MRIRITVLTMVIAMGMALSARSVHSTNDSVGAASHVSYVPIAQQQQLVQISDSAKLGGCKGFCIGVAGHVQNLAAVPVYAVTLQADFYDEAGKIFGTRIFSVALPVIFPGETSPFKAMVMRPFDINTYQYSLTIAGFEISPTATYRPITVVSTKMDWYSNAIGQVHGEIWNDNSETLHTVQIVVSYQSGDYETIEIVGNIAPGVTTLYSTPSLIYRGWFDESAVEVQGIGIVQP